MHPTASLDRRFLLRVILPLFGLIAQYGNIGFYPVYLMIFAVLMIVLYGLFTKGQGKKA